MLLSDGEDYASNSHTHFFSNTNVGYNKRQTFSNTCNFKIVVSGKNEDNFKPRDRTESKSFPYLITQKVFKISICFFEPIYFMTNKLKVLHWMFPSPPPPPLCSSTMPVTSLHVEKSPQTRRILRPTQLPPSVPPLGAPEHTVVVPSPHQPRKASPESFEPPPSLEAAAPQYVNRVEASPDILHGTTDVPDGRARKENNHNSLVYQNGKDSPSSPEEFSVSPPLKYQMVWNRMWLNTLLLGKLWDLIREKFEGFRNKFMWKVCISFLEC